MFYYCDARYLAARNGYFGNQLRYGLGCSPVCAIGDLNVELRRCRRRAVAIAPARAFSTAAMMPSLV